VAELLISVSSRLISVANFLSALLSYTDWGCGDGDKGCVFILTSGRSSDCVMAGLLLSVDDVTTFTGISKTRRAGPGCCCWGRVVAMVLTVGGHDAGRLLVRPSTRIGML